MKQIIWIIGILLISSLGTVEAQRGQRGGQRSERIHAIKVGYLTDRLQLSRSQAAEFWPVYNDYEQERSQARRAFRDKYRDRGNMESSERASQYIDDDLDYQQQILSISKKYKDEFLRILSPQQVATLYDAEREFKKMLIQQLRDRREGGRR